MSDSLARRGLARAAAHLNAAGRHAGYLPSLVLLTDDERLADAPAAARALPRGSLVIVRSREAASRARLAASLLAIARERNLFVLISDDPELAARSGADGLHLPEARLREASHWRARKPGWLITVAAHSLKAVARAETADAVLLAPVFATSSHRQGRALSPERANAIAAHACVPVYALGGINVRNASLVCGPNYAGLAAISALLV